VISFHFVPKTRSDVTLAVKAQQYSPSRGVSDNTMNNPARPGDRITL
jgi:hypothetical protein